MCKTTGISPQMLLSRIKYNQNACVFDYDAMSGEMSAQNTLSHLSLPYVYLTVVCCSFLLPRRRRLVRGCVNRARPHNKLQCSPFVLHDTCEAEPAYLLTQTPRHGISHTPFDQTRCARECACGCCSCVFVLVSGLLFRVPASAPVCVCACACDPPGRLNVVDDAWHKRACV